MSAEPKSSGTNIQQLKELMFFEEQEELDELRSRLNELEGQSVDRLAEDLAEAIKRRRQLGDDAFGEYVAALQAGTESAIQRSVSEDKSRLSTALFPIMGPAIRSYVTELFRGMAEELNEAIKNTTSIERIKWRAEAKMAGMPYSEYVLLKTRIFKIEEVYLMQRDTGLLLLHASTDPESEASEEADLVSGMFTAIRSFVKDSFGKSADDSTAEDAESEELDSFTFGEREVLIEVGPSMVLAAVAHGVPPSSVSDELKTTLENLHAEMQGPLDRYSGDMSELESARPTLRTALMERKPASESKSGGMWRAWLVLGLLAIGIGLWMFLGFREQNRWDKFETALREQPGVSVSEVVPAGWWRHRLVSGVRDPLSADPQTLLNHYSINPEKTEFHFELIESLHPEIAAMRAKEKQGEREAMFAKVREVDKRLTETESGIAGKLSAVEAEVTGVKSGVTDVQTNLQKELLTVKAALEAEKEERNERTQKVIESLVRSEFGAVEGLKIKFIGDGSIVFSGSVLEPEFSTLQARLAPLKALGAVDTSELRNGTIARIKALIGDIEGTEIAYRSGSLEQDRTRIATLIGLIKELDSMAIHADQSFRFVSIAHPLIGDNRSANRKVEETRARQVSDQLIQGGIAAERVATELSENLDAAGSGVRVKAFETGTTIP